MQQVGAPLGVPPLFALLGADPRGRMIPGHDLYGLMILSYITGE